jgi:hypothetical protein
MFRLRFLTILGLGFGSLASAAEMFPFVLPWDDASPTVTDLEQLERQAGRRKRLY